MTLEQLPPPLPPGSDAADEPRPPQPAVFPHPPWTVGVVLVLGAVFLLLGLAGNPLWLIGGSPFILVLLLWLVVRGIQWRRARR